MSTRQPRELLSASRGVRPIRSMKITDSSPISPGVEAHHQRCVSGYASDPANAAACLPSLPCPCQSVVGGAAARSSEVVDNAPRITVTPFIRSEASLEPHLSESRSEDRHSRGKRRAKKSTAISFIFRSCSNIGPLIDAMLGSGG